MARPAMKNNPKPVPPGMYKAKIAKATTRGRKINVTFGEIEPLPTEEYTGGSVSYYRVAIQAPTTPGTEPYIAECNDIIEALGLDYAQGNVFKAIWRAAAARKLGMMKRGYDAKEGIYDAEKQVFFSERTLLQRQGRGNS